MPGFPRRAAHPLRRSLFPFLLLALAASPTAAKAQESPPRTRIWADVGLTAGTGANVESGLGYVVQLNVQRRPHFFALRTVGLVEFEGFPDGGDGSVGDFGVLYGRSRVWSWAEATVAAGLAVVGTDTCEGESLYGGDACLTVGLPLMARVSAQSAVIGVGVELFADVNVDAPFWGLGFFIQLGWMP